MEATIGQQVAALRKVRGWSQAELARQAKVSRQGVSRIEKGLVDPTWQTVTMLVKALGGRVAVVLEVEEP